MSQLARIHLFAGAVLLATTATACSTSTEIPLDFTADTGGEATAAPVEPRVIAEVTSREGATVRFLDERAADADPVISVEIASPASTPVLDALLAQQPTALELYRAIEPGQAPSALVREHQLIAEHDASYGREPRLLSAAGVAQTNLVESFACGTFAHWKAAFDAWAPPLDGHYAAAESATTSGYVGYAPKFYFDVCRTTSSNFAYVARTERRTNASAAWSIYDDGSPLGVNQRYRFFRNTFTCSSYQYRLYVVPAGGGSYYRGATWADEFSCQIGL